MKLLEGSAAIAESAINAGCRFFAGYPMSPFTELLEGFARMLPAHTFAGVDTAPVDLGPVPPKDWALDGSMGGTGRSRQIWTWASGKFNTPGPGPDGQWKQVAAKFDEIGRTEMRWEQAHVEDA